MHSSRVQDNHSRFFHAKDVRPKFAFETLERGSEVTFLPSGNLNGSRQATNNGLRATQVIVS